MFRNHRKSNSFIVGIKLALSSKIGLCKDGSHGLFILIMWMRMSI